MSPKECSPYRPEQIGTRFTEIELYLAELWPFSLILLVLIYSDLEMTLSDLEFRVNIYWRCSSYQDKQIKKNSSKSESLFIFYDEKSKSTMDQVPWAPSVL